MISAEAPVLFAKVRCVCGGMIVQAGTFGITGMIGGEGPCVLGDQSYEFVRRIDLGCGVSGDFADC
jgi:hypothetical protein